MVVVVCGEERAGQRASARWSDGRTTRGARRAAFALLGPRERRSRRARAPSGLSGGSSALSLSVVVSPQRCPTVRLTQLAHIPARRVRYASLMQAVDARGTPTLAEAGGRRFGNPGDRRAANQEDLIFPTRVSPTRFINSAMVDYRPVLAPVCMGDPASPATDSGRDTPARAADSDQAPLPLTLPEDQRPTPCGLRAVGNHAKSGVHAFEEGFLGLRS